ncbi:MAG: 2-isopropylmalate synthase [Clostridia bacterium]|nr:2-isopropylmalate synthase [Clostridia bacterium]
MFLLRTVKIFDSTLRDGEQSPGFSMSAKEKIKMARALELLGADVIEAGFPAASPGDFDSVAGIASSLSGSSTVAALARLNTNDIDLARDALKGAKKSRIHVFIATSDIHLEYKLHINREELIERVKTFVAYAAGFTDDLEFSAEDATRSDLEFLIEVYRTAVKAGATIINVPDTVGYASPEDMARIIKRIRSDEMLKEIPISVHCHNDLGMAVANSLEAVRLGADQVECTVNGIGERAGNAALEEVVMNLKVRGDYYDADTNINTKRIITTSKLLSMITGVRVQPNKAITGANAFAHEAGIHQHGVMENRATYEVMTPESVGLTENVIVLGKHSGRHAFEEKLQEMGLSLPKERLDTIFADFKLLADKKKVITDKDIEALLKNSISEIPRIYRLDRYIISSSNMLSNTCCIRLKKNGEPIPEGTAMGGGPIDAAFNAINLATGLDLTLAEYKIEAVTGGADAQGAVSVRIRKDDKAYKGYGVDPNIFEASIKAYLSAINNMLYQLEQSGSAQGRSGGQ